MMDDSEKHRFDKIREFASKHVSKDSRVLNAGSSDGQVLDNLRLDNVVNVDIRKNNLKNFILGDCHELPFKDDIFDLCIFTEVLAFVQDPLRVIREIQRTSKKVLVTSPNNTTLRKGLWLLRGKTYWRSGNVTKNVFWREYNWNETKKMFEDNGFQLVHGEGIGFIIGKPKYLHLERLENVYPRLLSSKVLMLFEREKLS
ncbi:MAG: methyltransferase domain-containing protein [Candidatus Altiarchaeota archaeon]